MSTLAVEMGLIEGVILLASLRVRFSYSAHFLIAKGTPFSLWAVKRQPPESMRASALTLLPLPRGNNSRSGDNWEVCWCTDHELLVDIDKNFKSYHVVYDTERAGHKVMSAVDYMEVRCANGVGTDEEKEKVERRRRGARRTDGVKKKDQDFYDYVFWDPSDSSSSSKYNEVRHLYD